MTRTQLLEKRAALTAQLAETTDLMAAAFLLGRLDQIASDLALLGVSQAGAPGMTLDGLLTRLFRHEEINGADRCPTYLHRWTLFQPRRPRLLWRGFGIYLHKFVGADWSHDLHDHPKRFISIGLKGGYVEETPRAATLFEDPPLFYPCGCSRMKVEAGLCDAYSNERTVFLAPWIRTFPATHIHRLSGPTPQRPCWTLVIVLRSVREWGFWHGGWFIHWREYVQKGNPVADSRKACP